MKMFELIKQLMTLGDTLKGYKTHIAMAALAMQGIAALLTGVILPGINGDASTFSLIMAVVNSVELVQIIAAFGGSAAKAGFDRK